MAKGFFVDQTPGLAKQGDRQVYGEGGNLNTHSHSTNFQQRGARTPGDRYANGRVRGVGGNQNPSSYKITGRARRG
jgi:hypothetical protein